MDPAFDIRLDRVPAILGTTPEAVEQLIERGELSTVQNDAGIALASTRHIRSSTFGDLLTVVQFAASKAITVEQCKSLVRLGVLHASTPFAPSDPGWRIPRSQRTQVTDEQVARTTAEIEQWTAQQEAQRIAAEAQAAELASRTSLDELALWLGCDKELIAAAVLEVLPRAQEIAEAQAAASKTKSKAGKR